MQMFYGQPCNGARVDRRVLLPSALQSRLPGTIAKPGKTSIAISLFPSFDPRGHASTLSLLAFDFLGLFGGYLRASQLDRAFPRVLGAQ
jgi:hypothetical protein